MTHTANDSMSGRILVRPKSVIFLHWFNATCWFLLTPSGLGIVRGETIRIIPAGWSEFLQNLVGGNANLVLIHSVLGIIWSAVILLFILLNLNSVVMPFLKNVLSLTPKKILDDINYMIQAIVALFTPSNMEKKLPPSGRYNGAQRLLGTMIIACSIAIAVTGLAMFFGPNIGVAPEIFRWSLVLHALCVGVVWIGLVAHIYYGAIEEPEALEGMKSGYLETGFVKHHHSEWYEELKRQGQI
jgi:formate dehydrogenase subunit gamma